MAAHETPRGVNWAGVAAAAGYADQSHFSRETRRVTGFAPGQFRRRMAVDESAANPRDGTGYRCGSALRATQEGLPTLTVARQAAHRLPTLPAVPRQPLKRRVDSRTTSLGAGNSVFGFSPASSRSSASAASRPSS